MSRTETSATAAGTNPRPGVDGEDVSTEPPDDAEFERRRIRMVGELRTQGIVDARVLEVLGRVPRHEFVPPQSRHRSYENSALPIDEDQAISQPHIVALMTQLLELKGSERVLEIGTGSGYQAAILGELVGDGEVYTVEIRETLHTKAKQKLAELTKRGVLHCRKIETLLGDGSKGYEAAAPYDAILVTAAPRRVPIALLNQLKVGGRMVIPVGDYSYQELQVVRRTESDFEENVVGRTLFVPLEEKP
jgi:protein-L-isoaspartate(D-aspartate) O-methyltransferase